jgi:polysaccharide biosynthesis protein PelD
MATDRPASLTAGGQAVPPERFRTRIGFARRWLEWRPGFTSWHLAETILLSLASLGLTYWLRPTDPLSLSGGFPWAWLAPVMLALRYGIRAGLISVALILVGWIVVSGGAATPAYFTSPTVLGGLILTLVCGEFSGLWRHRLRRQTELNQYLGQRIQELTRQHYLLKLSHDQLEENLIARPYTLRGALIELRELLGQAKEHEALPGAEAFMTLMTTHCQLTVAGLFPARGGQLLKEPLATSGEPGKLATDDMLVGHALEQRSLVHVNQEHFQGKPSSRYLVAAPIYRHGDLTGLLVVEDMPFFAFHHETLQTLAALISYFSDGYVTQLADRILARVPDCPREFAVNLERLSRVQEVSGVASHLAIMTFNDDDRSRSIRQRLLHEKRELDFYWLRDHPRMLLAALFPLTGEEGMQGYLARVDAWLESEYGEDHRGLGIRVVKQPLSPERVIEQLQALIEHGA